GVSQRSASERAGHAPETPPFVAAKRRKARAGGRRERPQRQRSEAGRRGVTQVHCYGRGSTGAGACQATEAANY
ncbi:unnamed protein product, partial [Ectocarpus sp. 12 AP-2014]